MGQDAVAVDVGVLEEMSLLVGDDVAAMIVETYVRTAPSRVEALEQAMVDGGRALRDAAHAMTAASATVGAGHLADLCWDIEARADRGDDVGAREVATRAVAEMPRVVAALQRSRWVATVD